MGSIAAILDCAGQRWSPRIGDPSIMGWITVAAYLATAVLVFVTISRAASRQESRFWGLCGLFLVCMAINKQLDLQSAVTAVGRCLAQAQGWYESRRQIQQEFIHVLLVGAGVAGIVLTWLLWRILDRVWLALLGMVAVMTFIVVRAVSFHHVDAMLNMRIHDIRMNWVLELFGPALIACNALILLTLPRRRRR